MPPKKSTVNLITVLKFKRSRITYTIPFTSTTSLQHLKQQVADAINNSGGVQSDEPEREPVDEEDDEENIPVPKSEFIENGEEEQAEVLVTPEQLRIAVPQDMSSPYDNQWLELDDSMLQKIKFKDYNILAFGVDDEPFDIVEAAYEEDE
ncbi:uncharacterized protein SPAPADRAFT_52437 [Spathaspora passalidarum NRRL Y-27907]|uniref:Uncharacterized protein n=1 Tax=Spathaspora passalidarum (strain NRRL Y-27907 / 11-Y1) TaxID=619300 RepID=G3ATW8_SPAPN|nr:uncharacterized protein SPAPADRAFT_52437 [Spathaspora passalidarum NRRL Y-27907]EGW30345.1 hypothetical protein SPAPADRAFT_52437 [Spathaspora passalidarum NRRL Y-27907]